MAISKNHGQRERRLGAAAGLIQVCFNLVSKLLIVPVILYYLDQAEFGLYQLMGAFVGYLSLIDFGISGTLGRFIANCQARNDAVGQDNVFAICMLIYTFIAGVIALLGLFMYSNLDMIFSKSLSPNEMSDAKIMFIILLISICSTIFGRAFIGVNGGHERFVFSRITDGMCGLARVFVVAAVLATGHRAIGVVSAEAVINSVILILNAVYAKSVLKVKFKLHYWDRPLFSEMLSFAFWTFLAALVIQLNYRLGTVLLGIKITAAQAGIYAIALQINTIYMTLPSVISSVFLPRITRLVVNEADGETLTMSIVGPSRYQLMLVGAVLGGFILFGRQFILLWAGSNFSHAWGAALLILVPVTIPICQDTILSILYAKMLNRSRAIITLVFALLNALCAFYLIPCFGLYGPAISTGLVLLLGHGLVSNLYYHYRVGLNMIVFFKNVSDRLLPAIVLVTILGRTLIYIPLGNGWVSLLVRLTLFLTLYGLIIWYLGLHKRERAFFSSLFQGFTSTVTIGAIQGAKTK